MNNKYEYKKSAHRDSLECRGLLNIVLEEIFLKKGWLKTDEHVRAEVFLIWGSRISGL